MNLAARLDKINSDRYSHDSSFSAPVHRPPALAFFPVPVFRPSVFSMAMTLDLSCPLFMLSEQPRTVAVLFIIETSDAMQPFWPAQQALLCNILRAIHQAHPLATVYYATSDYSLPLGNNSPGILFDLVESYTEFPDIHFNTTSHDRISFEILLGGVKALSDIAQEPVTRDIFVVSASAPQNGFEQATANGQRQLEVLAQKFTSTRTRLHLVSTKSSDPMFQGLFALTLRLQGTVEGRGQEIPNSDTFIIRCSSGPLRTPVQLSHLVQAAPQMIPERFPLLRNHTYPPSTQSSNTISSLIPPFASAATTPAVPPQDAPMYPEELRHFHTSMPMSAPTEPSPPLWGSLDERALPFIQNQPSAMESPSLVQRTIRSRLRADPIRGRPTAQAQYRGGSATGPPPAPRYSPVSPTQRAHRHRIPSSEGFAIQTPPFPLPAEHTGDDAGNQPFMFRPIDLQLAPPEARARIARQIHPAFLQDAQEGRGGRSPPWGPLSGSAVAPGRSSQRLHVEPQLVIPPFQGVNPHSPTSESQPGAMPPDGYDPTFSTSVDSSLDGWAG